MKTKDDFYLKIYKAVHLMWDPIGVIKDEEDFGEYDNYIFGIYKMLQKNPTGKEIFKCLWFIETNSIGLSGNREATEQFAKFLHKLSVRNSNDDGAC